MYIILVEKEVINMKRTNGINERIKEYRTQMQLSQEYVANYLNVNRATFSQIELVNSKEPFIFV